MFQSQYPWRTRISWECRRYMYFVDVGEAECLDVARALWLTGADNMTIYIRGESVGNAWWYVGPEDGRRNQRGGYSER